MSKATEIIRNVMESDNRWDWWMNKLAKAKLYRMMTDWMAKRKIENVYVSKRYGFAIEVTGFCNARCLFCPNSKMRRKKEVMKMTVFDKIIERIKMEKICPLYFNLGPNGEPLGDKLLFERIRKLKKNFPNSVVHFPTNLSLADEKIRMKLVESGLDNICVSLNADNNIDYETIMGLDFSRTIKNLKELLKLKAKRKSNLKVYLKLAANPVNKKTIRYFVERWKGKVDGIGVSWVHSWGGAVRKWQTNRDEVPRFCCRTLFEQINIQANGDIPLCCIDYEGEIVGGNILKDGILESINSSEINNIKKKHISGKINHIKMCRDCRFCERGFYWWV